MIWFHHFLKSHTISISGHCIWVMFKICQTVAGIPMISQFHKFLWIQFLKWLKTAQNKFTSCDFTYFWKNSHHIRFLSLHLSDVQNLSKCCRHNYDQSISRIFCESYFWRIFATGRRCRRRQQMSPPSPPSAAFGADYWK